MKWPRPETLLGISACIIGAALIISIIRAQTPPPPIPNPSPTSINYNSQIRNTPRFPTMQAVQPATGPTTYIDAFNAKTLFSPSPTISALIRPGPCGSGPSPNIPESLQTTAPYALLTTVGVFVCIPDGSGAEGAYKLVKLSSSDSW